MLPIAIGKAMFSGERVSLSIDFTVNPGKSFNLV
jgi:hypothetical protein